MSTILIYSPFNRRARDVESLILQFNQIGYKVISLNQREGNEFHPFLISKGIIVQSYIVPNDGSFLFFLRHLFFFVRFCHANKVEFVFSHLDTPNFIASIGQYFVKAKIFLCRHHIDEAQLYNYSSSWTYRVTNKLAKRIIVVSQAAIKYMMEVEQVPRRKLIHINLCYDFSLFRIPSKAEILRIKELYKGKLLLVTVCRLTKYKRPELSIEVLNELKRKGLDSHLLVLGMGELGDELNSIVAEKGLKSDVSMLGHRNNVLEYLSAADFVLHPSVLESSCVVIKEAGLVRKPVIVCKDVGDFNQIIDHCQNGFLVNNNEFVKEAISIITKYREMKDKLMAIGLALHETVIQQFSVDEIFFHYKKIVNE